MFYMTPSFLNHQQQCNFWNSESLWHKWHFLFVANFGSFSGLSYTIVQITLQENITGSNMKYVFLRTEACLQCPIAHSNNASYNHLFFLTLCSKSIIIWRLTFVGFSIIIPFVTNNRCLLQCSSFSISYRSSFFKIRNEALILWFYFLILKILSLNHFIVNW